MIKPMLAEPTESHAFSDHYAYEIKYDGIRAVIEATPFKASIFARSGADKTASFPDIASAAQQLAKRAGQSFTLDGEIVAVSPAGDIDSFQKLQKRIHVTVDVTRARKAQAVAFVAFDLLELDQVTLLSQTWAERRTQLNYLVVGASNDGAIRLGQYVLGAEKGQKLYHEAERQGLEGLIAKQVLSYYRPGKRSAEWLKLKFFARQEFVVAGWTEPRGSRNLLGALVLGIYKDGVLTYCGNAGTGFTEKELLRVHGILGQLETTTCPFATKPKFDEPVHWVAPSLMAECKYAESTSDGKLRFPVYLGLRDDKDPTTVTWERQKKGER